MKPGDTAGRILGAIGNAAAADILWVICSLPVFTAGASTAALYYCTVESVRKGTGNVLTDFFRVFKETFWKSLPISMIHAIYYAALAYAAMKLKNTPEYTPGGIYTGVLIGLLILGSWLLPYIFAVIARKDCSGMDAVRYAFYMSMKKIYFTLPLMILLWLCAAACVSRSVLLLFVPSAYELAVSFVIEPAVRRP